VLGQVRSKVHFGSNNQQMYYRKLNILTTESIIFGRDAFELSQREPCFVFFFLPPHDEPVSIGDDPPLLFGDILHYFEFLKP
jgi:hypothetical protein